MNKTYIKPSSERVTIFTESNVADGVSFLTASGSDQQVRRHDTNDSWEDWEDEEELTDE